MLKMTPESEQFLKTHLPVALSAEKLNDALDPLFTLICQEGFAPPDYYDYNDFGRQAQRVYDDLYYSNT